MDGLQWSTISENWDRLLDLSPEEREPELLRIEADNPALAQELRSLMAASEAAVIADGPAPQLADTARERLETGEIDQLAGTRVGAYRLERLIGRGGMGAVYLAHRDDGQFEQQVAIKLLPIGLRHDEWIRRFVEERQILARLQHPNIASLLDGGVTEDGTPYFVMTYVDGQPLDRYCDDHKLSASDRIALLKQVNAAVAHAHQNLIVHRDIKPGNILVDGTGVPKLLDFGIARLLSEQSERDATSLRALTPNFASPEHVTGEGISTLTDVYSLGAIAYQLFAGCPPLQLGDRTPNRLEAAILNDVPALPSRVCVAGRGVRASELRGDLDSIVMRCLRKQPANRYPSVDALTEDLRRYEDGFPIRAKPSTSGYRIRKFVSRHRLGVAAAALVSLSVLLGAAGVAWQARQTQIEAQKSERIAGFFAGMFDAANPFGKWREELTLAELLDQSAARAREDLADEPEVRAEMLRLMGVAQTGLGDFDEATQLLRDAADTFRAVSGPRSIEYAQSLRDLATALIDQGDYSSAIAAAKESREIFLEHLGSESVEASDALMNLAVATSRAGDEENAEVLYREALAVRQRILPPDDYRIADVEASLAALLSKRGQNDEALKRNRRALQIYESALGSEHPLTVRARSGVAAGLFLAGDHAAAESEFTQLLEVTEARVGPEHPETVLVLNNLGRVRSALGMNVEAKAVLTRAFDVAQDAFDEGHALRLGSTANLGSVLLELGDVDRAASLLDEAANGYARIVGDAHPVTARTRIALAEAEYWRGQPARAQSLAEGAIQNQDAPGMQSAWLIDARLTLARIYNDAGQAAAALHEMEQAESLIQSTQLTETRRAEFVLEALWAERQPLAGHAQLDALVRVLGTDHPKVKRYLDAMRSSGG